MFLDLWRKPKKGGYTREQEDRQLANIYRVDSKTINYDIN